MIPGEHAAANRRRRVIGEEWGLIGLITVLLLYMFVIGRSLYLAAESQDTFSSRVSSPDFAHQSSVVRGLAIEGCVGDRATCARLG